MGISHLYVFGASLYITCGVSCVWLVLSPWHIHTPTCPLTLISFLHVCCDVDCSELAQLERETEEARLHTEEEEGKLRQTGVDIEQLLAREEDLKGELKRGAVRTIKLERARLDTISETERLRAEYATKKKETLEKTRLVWSTMYVLCVRISYTSYSACA